MNRKRIAVSICIILIMALSLSQGSTLGAEKTDSTINYLSVLRVVNHYAPFDTLSWERAAEIKTTDSFQWFEAAIYHFNENETASAVHLYKFDASFDPYKWSTMTSEEWVNYRESYRLLKVVIPEGLEPEQRSHLITKAFMQVFAVMARDTPAQHYGIRYSGHGSGGGGLFANEISRTDAQWLFESVTSLLGRKIDLLDLGSNCGEGNMNALSNFYPYFDFVIASDLPVCGFILNPGLEYNDFDEDNQYPLIMTSDKSLKAGLTDLLELTHLKWENSSISIQEMKIKQNISLFDMTHYERMASLTYQELISNPVSLYSSYNNDLYSYIKSLDNHNEMESQFFSLRSEYRDNRDFLDWDIETYGLAISIVDWVAPDFSIFPPFQTVLVRQGETVEFDLLIRPINTFDAPLTLEALDFPSTINVSFSEVFGKSPQSVRLSVTTDDTTPLGLHTLQISASGGEKTHTAAPQIMVASDIIYIPVLSR
jgi:hypothetical protein